MIGKYRLPYISVGVKIYGLAISMLMLIGGVAAVNTYQIKKVDRKLSDLTTYTLVLQQHVTRVNTYALRQENYFEQALRQYSTVPRDPQKNALAISELTSLGQQVEQQIGEALTLAREAVDRSYDGDNIAQFARLGPILEILGEDHQDFQNQALEILQLWEENALGDIVLLEKDLDNRERRFNQRIYYILEILQTFSEDVTDQIEMHEQALLRWNLLLAGSATILGLTLATGITFYLVRPLRQLVMAAKAVEQGDLETHVTVHSRDELETLATSFKVISLK